MPTLDWIGKDKVINHHKDVPYKVFERKYSFDESGMHKENIHSNNMIIHGDNLEALKSLLPQSLLILIFLRIIQCLLMLIISTSRPITLFMVLNLKKTWM